MSLPLEVNGTDYNYPETGDTNWGSQATLWASAVTVGMLQRAGGAFTLTAEVDFGATYGMLAAYYKSKGTNLSLTGAVRLARTDTIGFRNQANSADLALGVSASNVLQFNGEDIIAGSIVNADIDAAAAIAFSKMAALTASRALQSGAGGVLEVSSVTATELGYLSGASSALQTQLNAKAPTASPTFTGTVTLAQDPASALQAATKQYVDAIASGSQPKEAVRVATTADGTFTTAFDNGSTVDGVVLATGDRILIKNQSDQTQNGLYIVAASGVPTRSTDADTWNELVGARVFVTAGTANEATSWVCTIVAGGTLGVNNVTFVQNSANQAYTASGDGIELSGNQFALELDGTTLSKGGSGLKVNEIANAQIAAAAAIAVNKLAAVTASRALVSDGSGFVSAATTTATEIGHVNGVTSAIQTQLDAKIAASVMTTNNDMIYRAAGVPARLAAGTDGYFLKSNSGVPTWTSSGSSWTVWHDNTNTSVAIATTWATATMDLGSMSVVGTPVGSAVTRSGNNITFPSTGLWLIDVYLGKITAATDRVVRAALYDQNSVVHGQTVSWVTRSNGTGFADQIQVSLSDVGLTYTIRIVASGSGATFQRSTIDSDAGQISHLVFHKLNI